ncbi:MAG TPA: SPOR domain-containing protein [Bacteroidales bacterium]|nr:SPOR domain-containing protein [Bacteroidales bacterium]
MNTGKYISELLYDHECVIIPGFGGFVGNYAPAQINPVHHAFHPPSKTLLFNVNLKQNDGLLANHIANGEHISFLEALRMITSQAESWKRSLQNGNSVTLDWVGRFYLDREGNLQFEQDREINYLPESFGLSPLISPAIRRTGIQKRMERRIARYIESPAVPRRTLPKALKWAAVLALPIGIAATLGVMNFDRIMSVMQNESGMLFSRTASTMAPSPVHQKKMVYIAPLPHIVHQPPFTLNFSETSRPEESRPFSVIVGAFRIRENADNLVSRLQGEGFGAFILDVTRGGLYRVCLESFTEKDQALRQLAAVRSREFSGAWLLQK